MLESFINIVKTLIAFQLFFLKKNRVTVVVQWFVKEMVPGSWSVLLVGALVVDKLMYPACM